MNSRTVFSPRLLAIWIAAAIVTFVGALYLMARGSSSGDAVGPSTFSRSAIGYAGIAEVLQRLGIPVVKSQYNSLEKLGPGSALVIAEPSPVIQPADAIEALLRAKTVLLVLPKWQGRPSMTHGGWIDNVDLVPIAAAQWTLDLATNGEVIRQPSVDSWHTNTLGQIPNLVVPLQLVKSDRLRPIVAGAEGTLVGEFTDEKRRLWVLTDPDAIANHGLSRDFNVAFSVALINALRRGDGSVVFDETVHGFLTRPSHPIKLLFEFPFVIATLQGAITLLLLLWATMARFGAPETAPAPLDAGRRGLIQNAAKLLEFAGHQRAIVQGYVGATIRYVADQVHAPRGLSDAALLEWLRRVGRSRGIEVDCAAISRRVDELAQTRRSDLTPLVELAREIDRWKREMIDEPRRSQYNR
jgi:hypothetical protein